MIGRAATSGSQSSLREANRSLIVDTVKQFGGLTQVELAGATGLSAATISTIVKELLGAGVVEVRPTSRSGRRAQMVTLARRVGLAAGVQVGHRSMRVVLGDFSHTVVAEQSLPLPHEHLLDTGLDRASLLIADLLERVGSPIDELVGVGLGLPAPVDGATGMISVRGVMRGWDGEHLAHVMSKRLARPVHVDNDANLGALAEHTLGASREHLDSVYVRASYGIGAGVVLNGAVYRGYAGTAGEIGHVQVDPQGAICRCGNRGCLDTVVGADALLASLRASHGNLTLRDVIALATDGDRGCARLVADAGEAIGTVVAGLCAAVNPQVVVVGGELAETGEILLGPLRDAVRRGVLRNQIAPLEVVAAELGPRAEVLGALVHVLQSTDVDIRGEDR
ncbi:ROK family protein [Beutenbergia cavernae DSM 12333]|uniref:ROK family protein n=1 Tax=Beutenbergia cavernae (strain ATCC BAA-8 / DSM 12333 / CCUG 43141 / JCM 11478 / NBRC 16432 / NCIMB 13614 / HKI 0122) TaxID=471853 RepID=C5BZR0_BEUC1|nr:ROK family transcriptional regulator [Beutenbergia cavernae]ACQ81240.1 ROK family protein [Beutenbergia cavernae DSM 12333]